MIEHRWSDIVVVEKKDGTFDRHKHLVASKSRSPGNSTNTQKGIRYRVD